MTEYAVVLSARMASTRLPGKTLAVYCPDGVPNLLQIIRRWQTSRRQPRIIVSVNEPRHSDLDDVCRKAGVPAYYRPGPVLDCMVGALAEYAPDARFVARALADNPLVDVTLADWRLDVLAESGAEGIWYGDDHSRITYAGATDVWSRAGWERITGESTDDEREHPGLFYWNRLNRFSVVQIPFPMREYLAPVRTELDTPEDLEMFRRLWQTYYDAAGPPPGGVIPTLEALDLLQAFPEIVAINAGVEVKTQTRARWRKGYNWLCEKCQTRMGAIV